MLPDGAFYAWVNVEDTGIPAPQLADLLLTEAGVATIPGRGFGPSGENYLRLSFAASQAQLHEAAERMRKASVAWAAPAVTSSR
jgi:aspartate/methionine/tyrosine aminotransferase